jgi:uridine kinase
MSVTKRVPTQERSTNSSSGAAHSSSPRKEPIELPRTCFSEELLFLKERIEEKLKSQACVIVEIAGGSASGKTMMAENLVKMFYGRAEMLSTDNYCRGKKFIEDNGLNYDHPDVMETNLLKEHLLQLKEGKTIEEPIYSFKTCERDMQNCKTKASKPVIVVEGLYAIKDELAEIGDVRVFVKVDFEHGGILRRLFRDRVRSSWSSAENLKYMLETVIPMYREHVLPTAANADFIINNEYDPQTESKTAGICEAQIKYKANFDVDLLSRIGAERMMAANQVDFYYNTRNDSFKRTGEQVRVREESGKKILTYKGPKTAECAERQKFVIEIDGEIQKGLSTIYKIDQTVEKERTLYLFKGVMFSLDSNVSKEEKGSRKELGSFIEIKMEHYKEDARLTELLTLLKTDPSGAILTSYSEM